MTDLSSQQHLFELDEILVVVLRHMLKDKRSISELFRTSKLIQKRLCSTALWTSLGYLFYEHNDKTITPKMLWHLLRERQIELHLQEFASMDVQDEKTADKLKYLAVIAEKSAKEAYRMVYQNWLETPLLAIVRCYDKPYEQELTCKLLDHLFLPDLTGEAAATAYDYAPVLVGIVRNNAHKSDKLSLVLAACSVLGRYSEMQLHDTEVFSHLASLSPVLLQLMAHENIAVQTAAFRVAGTIVTGNFAATSTLENTPGFWPAITEALSSPHAQIRKDAAWTLSNIAAEGASPFARKITTEPIFKKLLAFRFEREDIAKEALWTFQNLLINYPQLSQAGKSLWQKYFDDIIDLAERSLKEDIRCLELGLPRKANPSLHLLQDLPEVIMEFPNPELWLQNLAQRELLVTLLQSPTLEKDSHGTSIRILNAIRGHNGDAMQD